MDPNLNIILQQLQAEKSIERDILIEAIRSALESAARKSYPPSAEITVDLNPDTMKWQVYEIRTVVEDVEDPVAEIALPDAQAMVPAAHVGSRMKVPTEPRDFGRIAAQTAKQVIIQKLKDAERDNVYEAFKNRKGELVTGVVKRVSHGSVIVGIGKAEAILPHREQSPRESFKPGDRLRAYIVEVERSPRGPQVVLSRATPELVRTLFEIEVPEIYDGTIEIKGIAREAGNRTKIAVQSHDSNVDPVGACVGMKGSRVRTIVEELSGEKIDIVRWSDNPAEMCANALNPADIVDLTVDEANQMLLVVVPHDQLSLAIGKRGQNARLASRLMGWNIDISSDEQLTAAAMDELGLSAPAEPAAESTTPEAAPADEAPEPEAPAAEASSVAAPADEPAGMEPAGESPVGEAPDLTTEDGESTDDAEADETAEEDDDAAAETADAEVEASSRDESRT